MLETTEQADVVNKAAARGARRSRSGVSALRRARYGNWTVWTFVVPPFGLLLFFVVWPAIYLAYLSLLKWDGLGARSFVGLSNYTRIFADDRFFLALRHNAIWSLGSLIFPPLIGLGLAILLTRSKVRGRGLFTVIFFLPQMISSAVTAVIWRWIYWPQGGTANAILHFFGYQGSPAWFADRNLALPAIFMASCWVAYGFSMLIFQAAISSIDENLFEAAQMDGANWWHETRYILIPGIRQALATVLIVSAIWSFQIFDLIYLTTKGGPGDATYVLSIGIYNNTFTARRVGVGAAWAMVLMIIVMGLAALMMRRQGKEAA
jgi:ABC-type sugar transport system permease subunit